MRTLCSCGIGIHLAKSLRAAIKYVPNAKEFYFARSGVILGEDEDKIRCASCEIVKKLSPDELKAIEREERTVEDQLVKARQMRDRLGQLYDTGGLPGKDWLLEHYEDITQMDFDEQKIELFKDGKKVCSIKPIVKRKDARYIFAQVTTQA